jgi:ribonuclease HI
MSDTADQQLQQLAYKTERAAAAKLAARQQLAPAQALKQVLTLAAGQAGLAHLVAERQAQQQRSALRAQARSAAVAQRKAQRQAARRHCNTGYADGRSAAATMARLVRRFSRAESGPHGHRRPAVQATGQTIEISQPAGYGNSSEAEYLALTALLQAAVQAGVTELAIRGDSQVVVNDVNLTPQAIAAGQGAAVLAAHRQEVCALIAQIGKVELRWLPRHRNAAADQLAQQAQQAFKLKPPAL